MARNLDKFKKDLENLLHLGEKIYMDVSYRGLKDTDQLSKEQKDKGKELKGSFEIYYQKWYTESHSLIKQLIPDRLVEFEQLYKGDGKRKEVNVSTYNIQDWLNGVRAGENSYGKKLFDDLAGASMRYSTQYHILRAVENRFTSSLFDIRLITQADLLDSELEVARELNKHRFARAAGAVAGVVLEKHLREVVNNRVSSFSKTHPTISELNDALKNAEIISIPQWRHIQLIGDIRNLCAHNKNKEPTDDDIETLISGVEKVTKTVF